MPVPASSSMSLQVPLAVRAFIGRVFSLIGWMSLLTPTILFWILVLHLWSHADRVAQATAADFVLGALSALPVAMAVAAVLIAVFRRHLIRDVFHSKDLA